MKDDPIVEEARRAGEAYVQSFAGDLSAVVADLMRRTEEAKKAGQAVVSYPPRKPRERSTAGGIGFDSNPR